MHQDFCNESSLLSRWAVWIATGLGIGLVVPAPGTVAGLWGVPWALACNRLPHVGWQLALLVLLGLFAVGLCTLAAKVLGQGDPGPVVLDEILVLPIVFLPTGIPNWPVLWTGWVLFRLFDILKPPPVRQAERLPAGWGIVADDVVAALYAAAALKCLLWLDAAWQWGLLLSDGNL
jgi:phosphatidylglycerophosphatase A